MSVKPPTRSVSGPEQPIRVMVVDDSAVIRGMIARWVGEAGPFEVVCTASNGRMAVDMAERHKPEIVLLDIEMPEVDGLAALPLLLKAHPASKVIVISTLTKRNAQVSLKCLSLGAVDYLAKPESARAADAAALFRRDLLEKLCALSAAKARQTPAAPATGVMSAPAAPAPSLRPGHVRPKCLLIGSSTGGPRAVERVLQDLGPTLTRIPVLIVQHMPPMFTAVFAEHLQTLLSLPCREAKDGDAIVAGTVLVAPGGRHMGVNAGSGNPAVRLNDDPPENFCRPAVDVLFREAASVFGASAVAVVLTGMGSDGTVGARHLVQAGATVMAQDEASSIVWGMPGSVVRAGLAHDVLPLDTIGQSLKSLIAGTSR
ncbi:protein-glutamate methylesterase/protein-glutamine glutaminase [Microvirga pakistanensis]|uniref:protein-glutamate methylesterase/protein-glutamine glutaminase n=1 Tax=Microvirga pakistanensis TaxID=1682650 RepID=UPI0010690234|nr:chemotaxis response regulator protein-glutamate methylesterase [Microvirga pakistanensis]